MNKLKRFFIIYASVFAVIWTGYGLFAVITSKPSAYLILGYGVAFSVVMFGASWFAYWLMGHYKKIDKMAKDVFSKNKHVKE